MVRMVRLRMSDSLLLPVKEFNEGKSIEKTVDQVVKWQYHTVFFN